MPSQSATMRSEGERDESPPPCPLEDESGGAGGGERNGGPLLILLVFQYLPSSIAVAEKGKRRGTLLSRGCAVAAAAATRRFVSNENGVMDCFPLSLLDESLRLRIRRSRSSSQSKSFR